FLLAKGDPFTVRFTVRGVVPEKATVSVELPGAGVTEDAVPLASDPPAAEPTVEHRIDANRVPRDFRFRVVANDYDTGWLPLVGDHPLTPLAARMLADEVLADVPVRVSGPEGTLLEAEFTPYLPGLYALRLTDEVGLTGVRLFDFRLFPDPAPAVVLERPTPG